MLRSQLSCVGVIGSKANTFSKWSYEHQKISSCLPETYPSTWPSCELSGAWMMKLPIPRNTGGATPLTSWPWWTRSAGKTAGKTPGEFSFSLNLFPRKQTSLAGKSPFWKGIHIDSFRVGLLFQPGKCEFSGVWGNFGSLNMSIPKPFLWNKQKRSIDLRQPSHVMCWRFTRFRGGEIESWNPLWLRFWEMMNF